MWGKGMALAIELIVDSYVQLKDRVALQVLLDRREKLALHLRGVIGFDVAKVQQEIESDINVISAGLMRIDSPMIRLAK
jgi:hypothetical protein